MTTIIRAGSPAEFLSLVPHLAGYQPRRSVVLVPFHGSRTIGLLRLDLPRTNIAAFASTAIGMVCRVAAADAVAIIVYVDDGVRSGGAHAEVIIDEVRRRADACGLRVGDALCVARDGWVSYLNGARGTLDELSASTATATAAPLRPSQASGSRLPTVPADERAAVRSACRTLDDLHGPASPGAASEMPAGGNPASADVRAALDAASTMWRSALAGDEPITDPYRAAMLLWMLSRPAIRDVALAFWCHGQTAADRVLASQLMWSSTSLTSQEPNFLAGEGPRPDADRLLTVIAHLRRLAALANGQHRATALTVLSWLSWALGAGTHAAAYAQRALRADPRQSLAAIVVRLTHAGVLPDWAFAPPRDAAP